MMRNISIAVKPTLSCNIGCKHCYHADEKGPEVMSYGTLERVVRLASEEYGSVWFIWHGGEPLLVPLSFYKNAMKLQEKYFGKDSHRVGNTIQTNGTLIDKRFMNFCRERKINVGVSSEGPYSSVLRGKACADDMLDMMRREGYMFSVSSTVCRSTVKDMMNIYDHFMGKGMALSFSPVICSGSAGKDMVPDADEYADASIRVFDKWLYDKDADMPLMPHLMYMMSALGRPQRSDCAHSSCLMNWISVYPNGDLYPCAKGCPQKFRLGNIGEMSKLSDAFASDAFGEMLNASVERREKCASGCGLYRYCAGGCSVDALSEGSMEENGGNSCKVFKKVFSHILAETERILNERPDLSQFNKFVREAVIGKLVSPDMPNV